MLVSVYSCTSRTILLLDFALGRSLSSKELGVDAGGKSPYLFKQPKNFRFLPRTCAV